VQSRGERRGTECGLLGESTGFERSSLEDSDQSLAAVLPRIGRAPRPLARSAFPAEGRERDETREIPAVMRERKVQLLLKARRRDGVIVI